WSSDVCSSDLTFVNGKQVTGEALLRPGGVFRLGTVDVRLEVAGAQPAPTPKKLPDHTTAIPQGVKLDELDQTGKTVTFDKNSPFAKKSDKGTKLFITVAIAAGVLILGAIIFLIATFGKGE